MSNSWDNVPPGKPAAERQSQSFRFITGSAFKASPIGPLPFQAKTVIIFNASQKQLYFSTNLNENPQQLPYRIVPPYAEAVITIDTDTVNWAALNTQSSPPIGEIITFTFLEAAQPESFTKLPDGLGLETVTLLDANGNPVSPLTAGQQITVTGPAGGAVGVSGAVTTTTPISSLGALTWTGPLASSTVVGTIPVNAAYTGYSLQWGLTGSIVVRVTGSQTGQSFWSGTLTPSTSATFVLPHTADTTLSVAVTDAGGSGARSLGAYGLGTAITTPSSGVSITPFGGNMATSRPTIYQGSTPTFTAPVTDFVAATLSPPAGVSGIALQWPAFGVSGRIQIRGTGSGAVYFDASLASASNGICALTLGPNIEQFQVIVWDSSSGTRWVNYAWIYDQPAVVVGNYGNTPLIVQPATGSSQNVVPGTSASANSSTVGTTLTGLTVNQLGGGVTIARPGSIYGLIAAARSIAQAITSYNFITFGLQGATSGTVFWFAMRYLGGDIAGGTIGCDVSEKFEYPFAGANLFPSDANVKYVYGTGSGGTSGTGNTIDVSMMFMI